MTSFWTSFFRSFVILNFTKRLSNSRLICLIEYWLMGLILIGLSKRFYSFIVLILSGWEYGICKYPCWRLIRRVPWIIISIKSLDVTDCWLLQHVKLCLVFSLDNKYWNMKLQIGTTNEQIPIINVLNHYSYYFIFSLLIDFNYLKINPRWLNFKTISHRPYQLVII